MLLHPSVHHTAHLTCPPSPSYSPLFPVSTVFALFTMNK